MFVLFVEIVLLALPRKLSSGFLKHLFRFRAATYRKIVPLLDSTFSSCMATRGKLSRPHSFTGRTRAYMATIEIVEMMRSLRAKRSQTRKELKKLDKVISALRELSSANSTPTRNGRSRRMSASARRKIGAAQRKRWAKVRRERA